MKNPVLSQRRFLYNALVLEDPLPEESVETVRAFYARTYPELATAIIEGPTLEGGDRLYTFKRAVGTKG